MQASDWAANASFSSTRSRSLAFQPLLPSALVPAGIGPSPIRLGCTPAVACGDHAGERLEPVSPHDVAADDEDRRTPRR